MKRMIPKKQHKLKLSTAFLVVLLLLLNCLPVLAYTQETSTANPGPVMQIPLDNAVLQTSLQDGQDYQPVYATGFDTPGMSGLLNAVTATRSAGNSALSTTVLLYESEYNDAFAAADLISDDYWGEPLCVADGLINAMHDVDVYRLTVACPGQLNLLGAWTGSYHGSADGMGIHLYNEKGTHIDVSDWYTLPDWTDVQKLTKNIQPGTYYFAVSAGIPGIETYAFVNQEYAISVGFIPIYTVTFDSQGGSSVADRSVYSGDKIYSPSMPVKTGYTFGGWYKDAALTTPWINSTDVVTGNMTLYAKWTIKQYTVRYQDWDGTLLKSELVNYGSAATPPANPSRTGYSFRQWTSLATFVASDMTITPVYAINHYIVEFLNWDGSILQSGLVNYQDAATPPAAPVRTGYSFSGWDKPFTSITANTTVIALFAANSYTVTFKNWDNSTLKTETVNYGRSATAPAAPSREGFAFTGWDATFNSVTANMTVTAQFASVPSGQFVVLFNDWNGSTIDLQVVTGGNSATAPANPGRTGYTFGGWDKAYANISANLTVTALYTINQYTVFFDKNGGDNNVSPSSMTINYNTTITEPAAPTRTGYAFGGWYQDANCQLAWIFTSHLVTGSITLYAKWTPMSCTVTFDPKEGSVSPLTATKRYDSAYGLSDDGLLVEDLPTPTRAGYAFFGWWTGDNGTGNQCTNETLVRTAGDHTLYAKWITVKYQSHVQNIGWQGWKYNGEVSGTSGQSLRLEAMRIAVENLDGGIEYRTHVQNLGWLDWAANGALSGTEGQSLRLEAINIRLTGNAALNYDIYYRVHAQQFGWMDWAKNGAPSGTAGFAYRLEAIEIVLVAKNGPAPGPTTKPFVYKSTLPAVKYQSHVQNIGWQAWMSNGEVSGTSGQALRLEAMRIAVENLDGGIEYRTHVQNLGWLDWVANGALSGTEGQSLRLEAINIRLTGNAALNYDIYYRVHAQQFGWMDWARNGASAGTAGYAYRLEAIEIVLVEKGGPAPGPTANPFAAR